MGFSEQNAIRMGEEMSLTAVRPWLILLFIGFSLKALSQNGIDLSEGTLSLNGSFTAQYDLTGFEKPEHRFSLKSDVGGGYFVIDNFEIGASLPIEWIFAPKSGGDFGLKVATTYFFNNKNFVVPYIGANVTPGYSMNAKSFQLRGGIDAGLLVSLSENLAFDFGLRPEVFIKIFDTQKWRIMVPAGYLGIRAVF